MTGVGLIFGMASYLRFTKADERTLQAVSFALVSVGTMLGFSSELTGRRSIIALFCVGGAAVIAAVFAWRRRRFLPDNKHCHCHQQKAADQKPPDGPRISSTRAR
jgi:hypothetical protein